MRVTVLGNTLLSRHFASLLGVEHPSVDVRLWTPFETRCPEFSWIPTCSRFHGLQDLRHAFFEANIVVNFHEYVDLTLLPDKERLQRHNVKFVRSVLIHLHSPIIQISTPLLQCSFLWPNVNELEANPEKYRGQWPFQEYCASKWEAEKLIQQSGIDSYVLRVVPVYGEGDDSSILTDLIRLSCNESVPMLGDNEGVMQMAYAGNVAHAVWLATCKLLATCNIHDLDQKACLDITDLHGENNEASDDRRQEAGTFAASEVAHDTSLLTTESFSVSSCGPGHLIDTSFTEDSTQMFDETDFLDESEYDKRCPVDGAAEQIFQVFLVADDTWKRTVKQTFSCLLFNSKRAASTRVLPYLPIFFVYCILSFFAWIISKLFKAGIAQKMPHPNFLFLYFRNWTCFNNLKSFLVLNYKPPYTYEESMRRCHSHYRDLQSSDVKAYSWKSM